MLALRGVRLRANNYFWGVCIAAGALALFAFSQPSPADESEQGKSTSRSDNARLEDEIQQLHDELASTKELLHQATGGDDLLLAQRDGGPPRANTPPADPPAKSDAKSTDDKKFNHDAWRELDKEFARQWRRGPGGPGGPPGMRGFHGGPPMWARDGFRGGPPWAHHHRHGPGGHGWAHHHHRGHRHWAHHRHHGCHRHWAHRHGHNRHGRGGPAWARRGFGEFGPPGFGPGPRGGEAMLRITQRLNMLERKIDALMHEVRGSHDGPDRGGPQRDGPPHDGPPRDAPPRNGGPRDAAPPRKPGA